MSNEKAKKLKIIISVAFCLAIGLRVYFALSLNFWFDELWAFYFANQSHTFWQHITVPLDDRPPLHYLLLKYLSLVWTHPFWLRLPSLLAGAVLLAGIISYAWKRNKIWGVVAAMFGAHYYFFVRMATQARDYGLMILVAWWQISLALSWLEDIKNAPKNNSYFEWKWFGRWAMTACLGVMLNYAYIPFLGSLMAAMAVVWLICRRREITFKLEIKRLGWMMLGLVPALTIACYYLFFTNQLQYLLQTTGWITDPNLHDVVKLLITLFGMGIDVTHDRNNQTLLVAQLSKLVMGFGLLSLGWARAWRFSNHRPLLLFGWLAVAFNVATVVIASYIDSKTSFFITRFFSPLSVVAFLLFSVSVWQIFEMVPKSARIKLGLVLFCLHSLIYLHQMNVRFRFFGNQAKYGMENQLFVNTIKTELKPGDQLVFTPKYFGQIYRSYYFTRDEYPGINLISRTIHPELETYCSMSAELDFAAGTKLILAVMGGESQAQPNVITIDADYPVYPNSYLDLGELCADTPVKKFQMEQTAVWICKLKNHLSLNRYSYGAYKELEIR